MPQDVIQATIVGIQGPPAVADGTSLITATGSSAAASLADRFGRVYNAKDFTGVVGNGSNNDTAGINAAITYISANGGGVLRFSKGTYMATQIVLKRLVILEGESQAGVELKQIASTNTDFILSENFTDLTGTGLNYGPGGTQNGYLSSTLVPSWFGLSKLRVNGNSNTARGVCFYGNRQAIQDVTIFGFGDQGLHTEASSAYAYSATDWKAQEEGYFSGLVIRQCGKGWLMRGPHDSIVDDYVSYGCGTLGFKNESSTGLYNGSCRIGKMHTYTETDRYGMHFGSSCFIDELYADFNRVVVDAGGVVVGKMQHLQACLGGTTALTLTSNATGFQIGNMNMQFSPSSATNCIGIDAQSGSTFYIGMLRTSAVSPGANVTAVKIRSSFSYLNANLENLTDTGCIGVDLGGSYNTVIARSFSCKTAMAYTPGHHNRVVLQSYNAGSNVTLSGTPAASDDFSVTTENSGVYDAYHRVPRLETNCKLTTTPTTALTDARVGVDCSGGIKTYTITGAPYLRRDLYIFDHTGSAGTNTITIDAGTGNTINGSQTITITTNYGWARLTGVSATAWHAAT